MTKKYSIAYSTGNGWSERRFETADGRRAFLYLLMSKYRDNVEFAGRAPKGPSECEKCGLGKNRSTCQFHKNGDCIVFLAER